MQLKKKKKKKTERERQRENSSPIPFRNFDVKIPNRQFPGGPMARTALTAGAQVPSLVRELRSHKPCMANK